MAVHDDLGNRMKEFYEQVPKTRLVRRMPVVIRIDGKAFHTFTKGFQKPFDDVLIKTMQDTMKYLCQNIQGCVFGYTQSDEITLILVDYKKLNSSAWFDYEVQKMCSISASMTTMAFNKFFEKELDKWWEDSGAYYPGYTYEDLDRVKYAELYSQAKTYYTALEKGAMFDARCFNIPKEEVANLIYWRQLDATRNSIEMLGRAHFSHKELLNKNCKEIQDMLHEQKGINWNDLPTVKKRGSACIKQYYCHSAEDSDNDADIFSKKWTVDTKWIVDTEMPIIKGEDREYIENLIEF